LAISDKQIIPRKREQLDCSGGIPAVPRNRKLLEFRSNRSAEEKNAQNSVPWNKNRSKLWEFCPEPFRGGENNSEFHSVEQIYKQTLGILFRTILRKRKQLGIPFRGTKIEENPRNSAPNHVSDKTCCLFCLLEQDFLSNKFFSCYFLLFRALELTLP